MVKIGTGCPRWNPCPWKCSKRCVDVAHGGLGSAVEMLGDNDLGVLLWARFVCFQYSAGRGAGPSYLDQDRLDHMILELSSSLEFSDLLQTPFREAIPVPHQGEPSPGDLNTLETKP